MNTTLETFKQQLLADKKKSAILSILLVVLVVVAVRALSPGNTSVPETVVAVQPVPAARPAATPTMQPVLTGREPLAYISGHLVRPGDRYAGFSIVRIEERRVLVEKYGQIHELVMR